MQTITLSEAALAMLRLHVEQDNIRIDDSNRDRTENWHGRA